MFVCLGSCTLPSFVVFADFYTFHALFNRRGKIKITKCKPEFSFKSDLETNMKKPASGTPHFLLTV